MDFEFIRYNKIDNQYIRTDLHIHSTWTDGADSIVDIIEQAKERNLHTIAITDHIRTDSTYLEKSVEEIQKLRKTSNIKILTGFEAKVNNFQGEVDVSVLNKNIADIKIASVHRFPIGRKLYNANLFSKKIAQEIELELSIAGIKKAEFDILGHPGGMSIRSFGEFPLAYFEEIIIECNKNNIVFELNSTYHSRIINDLKPILAKHNPLITFGSDAHIKKNIGSWLDTFKT